MKNNGSLESLSPMQVVSGIQATGDVIRKGANVIGQARSMTTNSLIEYTRPTRIEPIALIDNSLIHETFVSDLLHTLTSVFSSYYLRAISLMTEIGGVEVIRRLDRVNPNRDPINAVMSQASTESLESPQQNLSDYKIGTEAKSIDAQQIQQRNNLAVGKDLEVAFKHENQEYKMPVNVRLIPVSTTPTIIANTYSIDGRKNTLSERWHRFRAGELKLISEFILCTDMMSEHRNNLREDKSGFYKEVSQRRRKNGLAMALSATPSLAAVSNMAIISKRTAQMIERSAEVSLNDFARREQLFNNSGMMIFCVVDTDNERVHFYYKSIELSTEVDLRDLKELGGKSGPDISEVLKMFQNAGSSTSRSGVMF